VLALATVAIGLLVHVFGAPLGPVARDVLGDALWAAMIFWWISALWPRAPWRMRAVGALAICWAVEASQLFHTPALDAFRQTPIGQVTIGSGFDPRDLLAYAVGVAAAAVFDAVVLSRRGLLRRAH
jgi:hypothetical protein